MLHQAWHAAVIVHKLKFGSPSPTKGTPTSEKNFQGGMINNRQLPIDVSMVPSIYQKFVSIKLSNVYFFKYEHLKLFVRSNDNIFAHNRKIGNWAHFPN